MQNGYRVYRSMLDRQSLVDFVHKLWVRHDTHGEYEIVMICGEREDEYREKIVKYAARVGAVLKETRGCEMVF